MSKLITHIKRLALALCLATPFVSRAAVDYTGTDYEPWSYSAGCVVWRATSGQLFHASTVADVSADGTIGDPYTLNTSGHPWQVFASNQSAYTSPGTVLVFDEAGYNNNSDAQFAPMSFGGMWVKALQAENTPYCITDTTSSSARQVELGATGASTYFKFDESFTFDRNTATKVLGAATVEIASGKTFTINQRAGKGAVVEAGNTLILKGEGTLAVVGGLTISGTLDLSETTRPTIDGDVALAGTIVLPEGTEVSQESPFTVCSGTLSGVNVSVKIGDAEAVEKSFTAENGAITSFGEPIYIFTENYPTVVPAGETYTFVGGDSAENTVVVDALDVKGTLKTQGYFSFTNYKSNGSTLDVESGSLTLNPGGNWFNGTLTVEAGATFVNTLASDAVEYGGSFTANIYGTLAMGDTRWSLGSNNTINLYEGCTVTGTGSNTGYSALDWIENATATLNVYGDVTLEAPIRIRSTATVNVNVDSGDQAGLTLAGTAGVGKIVKKGAGLLKFTTNPPYAITVENGAFTFAVDATPTITYSAKPGTGTTMSMWYATQATWKGTVVIGVLSAPTALPLDTYGNANSKIVLKGTTGNCYLNGTTTVPAEVVIDTDEDHVVEFNNGNSGQIGTFSKISGGGTLKLTAWGNSSGVTYNINTFDGFTGTLAINNTITRAAGGTMTIGIGNIVTTGATTPGSKVLNLTKTEVSGTTGNVVYNLDNAQVNGTAAKLAVTANGVYVAVASTTIGGVTAYYNDIMAAFNAVSAGSAGDTLTILDGNEYGDVEGFSYNSETKTYTMLQMVAQIVKGVTTYKYTTLAGAVGAATDGDTVTLIATVNEAVVYEGENAVTIDLNGQTWSFDDTKDWAAFKNNGATVTFKDSVGGGKIVGGGKFCVWARTGSIVIESGTYENNSNDNYAVYVGTNDEGLGELPAPTATITGGAFVNLNTEEYVHKPGSGWHSLNLNVKNYDADNTKMATTLIQVSGGSFTWDPALGDDNMGGTFVASGYESKETSTGVWTVSAIPAYAVTLNKDEHITSLSVDPASPVAVGAPVVITVTVDDGYIVDEVQYVGIAKAAVVEDEDNGTITFTMPNNAVTVTVTSKVPKTPVTPGAQTEPVETAEAAEAEAAKVVPSVPTAVAEALSDEQETAYKSLFEAKVVEVKVGEATQYAVEVALTQAAETAIKGAIAPTELTTGTGEEVKPLDVASLATATDNTEVNVTTKPGIYYGVKAGSSLGDLTVRSCKMATSNSDTVIFPKAASTDKAMFWVIFASPTPVAVPSND